MTPDGRVWAHDANHAVGTVGPLVIQVWRGAKTFANWRSESTPVFAHVDRTTHGGYCVLIIVEERAEMPAPDDRRDVNELARERQGKIIASAVVPIGPTVRTAMVRSMVTAVNLFSRNVMRPFADMDEAVSWLVSMAKARGQELDAGVVRGLVRELRDTEHLKAGPRLTVR